MASDNCFRILKGPCRFGPSFAVGYTVLRFVPSIHTRSPSLYGLKLLFPLFRSFMTFCAAHIFCSAWSRAFSSSSIRAFRAGTPLGFVGHTACGTYPMIRSKGVVFVVAPGQEL